MAYPGTVTALPPAFASTAAYGSLADPTGSSALGAAVAWASGTLLGSAATTVAVIAVAFVGFAMLSGRIDARHGLTVVLGCFILSGAAMIAAGIQSFARGERAPVPELLQPPLATPTSTAVPPVEPAPQSDYDPHAGASVPVR